MDKVARLPAGDRHDIFSEAASRLGIRPTIIEKDFWVCFVLKLLFSKAPFKDELVFKGGTSLSKVYGLIERFSEDIDLVLDWRLLGFGAVLRTRFRTSAQTQSRTSSIKISTGWLRSSLARRFARSWTGNSVVRRLASPQQSMLTTYT
jgi:hypothetical protein